MLVEFLSFITFRRGASPNGVDAGDVQGIRRWQQ